MYKWKTFYCSVQRLTNGEFKLIYINLFHVINKWEKEIDEKTLKMLIKTSRAV